ncbi:MAG: hypothetical protein R3F14_35105 [Polyangiaceae bacterium]
MEQTRTHAVDELLQHRLAGDDRGEDLGARLDPDLETHRLVHLDHLAGQPRPQIARRPVHHAEQAHHVVRELGAAPRRSLSTVEK